MNFIFPLILGCDYHPNWLSYFSEGFFPNHQPEEIAVSKSLRNSARKVHSTLGLQDPGERLAAGACSRRPQREERAKLLNQYDTWGVAQQDHQNLDGFWWWFNHKPFTTSFKWWQNHGFSPWFHCSLPMDHPWTMVYRSTHVKKPRRLAHSLGFVRQWGGALQWWQGAFGPLPLRKSVRKPMEHLEKPWKNQWEKKQHGTSTKYLMANQANLGSSCFHIYYNVFFFVFFHSNEYSWWVYLQHFHTLSVKTPTNKRGILRFIGLMHPVKVPHCHAGTPKMDG